MPFDPRNLHSTEEIVLDMHPHWIMMAKAVVALVVSTGFGIFLLVRSEDFDGFLGTALKILATLAIVASVVYFVQRWMRWYSTNFVVTTDRCIYREGIISKRGIEIPLDRVNTVFFQQGPIERLVRAGDLRIESAGELGIQHFEDVRDPVRVQNILYMEMEDNENRKFDRVRAPAASSVADEISKLAALRDQGHLTPAEFESQKAALLSPGRSTQPPG
jgi:uncharacterized membrane protein YdbT with pleckstrin-like domain